MATDESKADNGGFSSTGQCPASHFARQPGSTKLDPIVLDDEDEDEDEQRRGTPALEKRPVAASDVSPRANKKAREEGQQLEEHIALLRSRVLDLERENATLNATLEEHFIGTEGYETIHIENVKLLEENKQLTNEIAELGRRIGDLMAERNINAVTIEKQGKELEVSKEEVAKLSTIECCSQVNQQHIAEMEEHMRGCTFANRTPEFWDHWHKLTSEIREGLAQDRETRRHLAE